MSSQSGTISSASTKAPRARLVLRSRQYFEAGFPLYISEVRQSAIGDHSHDFFEMVYVRRGRGTHRIGNDPFPVRAGDLFIVHPGEAHSYCPESGTQFQIVNVLWQPALVREVLRAGGAAKQQSLLPLESLPYIEPLLKPGAKFHHHLHLSGNAAFRVEVLLDEMRREVEAARQGEAAPGCHALLRHLFCALLVLLSRVYQEQSTQAGKVIHSAHIASRRATQQEAVSKAIAYLEKHWNEAVRVEQISDHVALSESRLSHLFKQHTGRSPIAYLHQLRLEHACALLRRSTLPAQTIAAECGFGDARFFFRLFRREFGCSPSQWREFGSQFVSRGMEE